MKRGSKCLKEGKCRALTPIGWFPREAGLFYAHFTPSLQENIKDLYFAAYVAQGKMLVCMLRKARCKRKAANDQKPAPNHLFN